MGKSRQIYRVGGNADYLRIISTGGVEGENGAVEHWGNGLEIYEGKINMTHFTGLYSTNVVDASRLQYCINMGDYYQAYGIPRETAPLSDRQKSSFVFIKGCATRQAS